MPCVNHLPKLVIYRTNYKETTFRYHIHSLEDKSLEDCVHEVHRLYFKHALEGLSDKDKLIRYFQNSSKPDAEFYSEKVGSHFILKINKYNGGGPQDRDIAHSLDEANRKIEKLAFAYTEDWVGGVKEYLEELRGSNGTAPGCNYDSLISHLESQLASFEMFDLTKN